MGSGELMTVHAMEAYGDWLLFRLNTWQASRSDYDRAVYDLAHTCHADLQAQWADRDIANTYLPEQDYLRVIGMVDDFVLQKNGVTHSKEGYDQLTKLLVATWEPRALRRRITNYPAKMIQTIMRNWNEWGQQQGYIEEPLTGSWTGRTDGWL